MYRAYVRCKTQTITVMCTVDVVIAALSENLVNKLYGTIYLLCVSCRRVDCRMSMQLRSFK